MGTMWRSNFIRRSSINGIVTINDGNLREILLSHKKRKLHNPNRPEYETNDIRLRDVHARTQTTGMYRKFHLKTFCKKKNQNQRAKLVIDSLHETPSTNDATAHGLNQGFEEAVNLGCEKNEILYPTNVTEISDLNSKAVHDITNINAIPKSNTKFSNVLDSITSPATKNLITIVCSERNFHENAFRDDKKCPEDLDKAEFTTDLNTIICNMNDKDSAKKFKQRELTQGTHVSFFSLIRNIFCSTSNHRIKIEDLKEKVFAWLSNPITALNNWYSHSDNWLALIESAVHFLAGDFTEQPDDFVPYLEFKINLNIYQWIGAGRDSDQHLLQLYNYWLCRRHEIGGTANPIRQDDTKKTIDPEEILLDEKMTSPPPPKCPTSWTVQPYSSGEVFDFRKQEKKRFENPHRAFTYKMHGYESIVGPVKGIYTQIFALTKARGHNMLVADRPNFVTILTLVRDATARLPNGEGTRADICELLKSSQYVNPKAQDSILQTIVSGALDRMHTEHDPCVRYDSKRKIWIYLHRNRTEEEFERLHQQYQALGKSKKTSKKAKQKVSKSLTPEETMGMNAPPINVTNLVDSSSSINQSFNGTSTGISNLNTNLTQNKIVTPELVPIKPQLSSSDSKKLTDDRTLIDTITIPGAMTKKIHSTSSLYIGNDNLQKVISTNNMQSSGTSLFQVTCNNASNIDSQKSAAFLPQMNSNQLQSICLLSRALGSKVKVNQSTQKEATASQFIESSSGAPNSTSISNCEPNNTLVTSETANAKISKSNVAIKESSEAILTPSSLSHRKTLLRVASSSSHCGKSLISPHVAATNITLQQQQKLLNNIRTPMNLNSSVLPSHITATSTLNKTVILNNTNKANQTLSNLQHSQFPTCQTNKKNVHRHNSLNLTNAIMISSDQISQNGIQNKIIFSNHGNNEPYTATTTAPIISQASINPQIIRIQPTGQFCGTRLQLINVGNKIQQDSSITPIGKTQKAQHTQSASQLPVTLKQDMHQSSQNVSNPTSNANPSCSALKTIKPIVLSSTKDKSIIQSVTNSSVKQDMTLPQSPKGKAQQTVTRVIKSAGIMMHSHTASNIPVSKANSENSVITKVITNNPGQIITLESLLQKQGTSSPLRLAGVKSNQTILQLGQHNTQLPHYALVSQGRHILPVANSSRVPAAKICENVSLNTSLESFLTSKTSEQNISVTKQPSSQIPSKVGITNQLPSQSLAASAKALSKGPSSGIRMVNASNLNITHIRGKPVIIAGKASSGQSSNQGILLQSALNNPNIVIGTPTLKLQGNVITPANLQMINHPQAAVSQTVILGNQIIKVHQGIPFKSQGSTTSKNITSNTFSNPPSCASDISSLTVTNANGIHSSRNVNSVGSKAVLLGSAGQTIRIQQPNTVNAQTGCNSSQQLLFGTTMKGATIKTVTNGQQRVVLAVQGSGQILLPSTFQGGAINLKAVQGIKVLSVTQQPRKDTDENTTPFKHVAQRPSSSDGE